MRGSTEARPPMNRAGGSSCCIQDARFCILKKPKFAGCCSSPHLISPRDIQVIIDLSRSPAGVRIEDATSEIDLHCVLPLRVWVPQHFRLPSIAG